VIDKPQEMKDPDEEKDAAGDGQVQLFAHCLSPIYREHQIFCLNPVLHSSSFTQTVANGGV
jgi:hypothetical protein